MKPQHSRSHSKRALLASISRPLNRQLALLLLLIHWTEAAGPARQAVPVAGRSAFVSPAEAPATPTAPTLGSQPVSVTVEIGHTARFDMWAYGTEPLTYRWRKNGTNLSAATNSWLIVPRVTANDAGTYDVVVADAGGSAQSAPATLTVLPTPPPSGPGSVDLSFPVALGWAGPDVDKGPTIYQMVRQPDGKILVAGFFDSVFGEPRHYLARLLPDGQMDRGFDPEGFDLVYGGDTIALQPDGHIVVAGSFTGSAGERSALIGLLSEGRLDTNFTSAVNPYVSQIHDLAIQPDGKILLAGSIALNPLSSLRQVARLNADGSIDTTFLAGFSSPGVVDKLAVQPDGKIIVLIGWFYSPTGNTNAIARLNPDGSPDPGFEAQLFGWGANCVQLLPDGKLVVGGWLNLARDSTGSFPFPGLARLHANGRFDSSFAYGGACQQPSALALQPDGKLLVGCAHGGVTRVLPDGSLDADFAPGTITPEFGGDSGINALMLQNDGRILVGGAFTDYDDVLGLGLVRLNNDMATPFVRREIATPRVQLIATPPTNVSLYAVEDQVQPAAVITHISDGGVFDEATGKVKFGPFHDAEPRTLSYAVLIPPGCIHGVCGAFTFIGTASADGTNTPVTGDAMMLVAGMHPADLEPADSHLSIAEVMAYGAAWRRGSNWPVQPVPISIDFVTRAAMLWRGGECYEVDPAATIAPLCWTSCQRGLNAPPDPESSGSQTRSPSCAEAARSLPSAFIPGEPFVVTVAVSPAAAQAHAVEERFPAGWLVANISDDGEFDAVNDRVKWGPFLDNAPRTLSYQATPPAMASGAVSFAGVVSFDGTSQTVTGVRQLAESCRVGVAPPTRPGQFQLTLTGRPGLRLVIEASSDLVTWTVLGEVTTGVSPVPFADPAPAQFPQRFYRASETH